MTKFHGGGRNQEERGSRRTELLKNRLATKALRLTSRTTCTRGTSYIFIVVITGTVVLFALQRDEK